MVAVFSFGDMLIMAHPKLQAVGDGTVQSLFDKFPTYDEVEKFISAEALDPDTIQAITDSVEGARSRNEDQIAAAIQADTPAGQTYPDLVQNGDGSDGFFYLVDMTTGTAKLDKATVKKASDIPIPGATPPPGP